MEQTKNLCAQIPISLHTRVREEQERANQTVSQSQAEPPRAQGRGEFVREQGRKAARTSGTYRNGKRGLESSGVNMSPAGQDRRFSGAVRTGRDPRLSGGRSRPSTHGGRIKTRVAEHTGRQTGKAVGRSSARTADTIGWSAGRMARVGQQTVRTRQAVKTAQATVKKPLRRQSGRSG